MLEISKFTLLISYGQISIFNRDIDNPFNDWDDNQYAQGFSWRIESVSFATIIDAGPANIEIYSSDRQIDVHVDAVRAINVPFEVGKRGEVEVASIADGHVFQMSPGTYNLLFQYIENGERGVLCRFDFTPSTKPEFNSLRAQPSSL